MKKFIPYIFTFLGCSTAFESLAQNTPSNAGLPSGAGSGQVNYSLDFNSSPNIAPVDLTYVKEFIPTKASATLPTNLVTGKVHCNTMYYNGWKQPLVLVEQNLAPSDVITPFDLRTSDTSLNYLPYPDVSGSPFYNNVYSKQKSYYNSSYPAENATAYSASMSYSISGVPTAKTYIPGRALVGDAKGTTTTTGLNTYSEVKIVTYDGSSISSSGYYNANTLTYVLSEGQHNKKIKEFRDKDGRLICKRVFAGGSTWLVTYYVYNDIGRLVAIVPPKATDLLATPGSLSNYKDYCFIYNYDEYGNMVDKYVPGRSDSDVIIYDYKHRTVLTRNPKLIAPKQLHFTVYDNNDRVVMAGIYTGTEDLGYWRGISAGTTTPILRYNGRNLFKPEQTLEYYLINGFTGPDYPDTIAGCVIYAYNYYDDYGIVPLSNLQYATAFSSLYVTGLNNEIPQPFLFASGKLVASRTRILDNKYANNFTNTPWITSVYYYDERSRLIQTQTQNPWSKRDTVSYQYNFVNNKVMEIACYHVWDSAKKPDTRIMRSYIYEPNTQRVQYIKQKIDTFAWENLAYYQYDNLGRVYKQLLCDVEEQKFTYNLRGQLIGINQPYLRNDTLPDNMSYASELDYETGFNTPRYDGKLSGYRWHSKSSEQRAYGYLYDEAGRMTQATYRDSSVVVSGTPVWNNSNRDFTVSNLSYDANGNILSMNQRGYDMTMAPATIDQLSYTYSGNRLNRVVDNGVNSPINDFDNGSTLTNNDYAYDEDGNLIEDDNKNLNISYNDMDMPLQVYNTADTISNIYAANGTLLQKRVQAGSNIINYRYWGPLVFKNDTLQYALHQVGRSRWVQDSSFFRQDVFVKDHQGNVRTVVTKDYVKGPDMTAGFEMSAANVEEALFSHVGDIRVNNPDGTPQDLMSGQLNGANNQIGTAIAIQVMAGDQISLQTYGYYENTDSNAFNTYAGPETMSSALLSTLTSGSVIGGEGGKLSSTTINSLLSPANYGLYDSIKSSITDRSNPRMYLNYLVYDDAMNLLPEESYVVQMQGPANTWNQLNIPGIVIHRNGYVLAYVSDESQTVVYLDNTSVFVTKGRLQQEEHYYPHGLNIEAGLATGALNNKFLFEGNELHEDMGLQLSDFHARQYDQQIGRFTAIDPLSDQQGQEMLSPYHFVWNDPANFTDPMGLGIGDMNVLPTFTCTARRPMHMVVGPNDHGQAYMGDETVTMDYAHYVHAGGSGGAGAPLDYVTKVPQPAAKSKVELAKEAKDREVAKTQQQIKSITNYKKEWAQYNEYRKLKNEADETEMSYNDKYLPSNDPLPEISSRVDMELTVDVGLQAGVLIDNYGADVNYMSVNAFQTDFSGWNNVNYAGKNYIITLNQGISMGNNMNYSYDFNIHNWKAGPIVPSAYSMPFGSYNGKIGPSFDISAAFFVGINFHIQFH